MSQAIPDRWEKTVSVILTCHNERDYIGAAIQSIVKQSWRESLCEIIVVNDGSSDDSQQVLEALAAETPLLRVIQTPGLRLPGARNVALREVSGSIIAILDGDDLWEPTKLERQLPMFDRSPRIGLVYSAFVEFLDGTDKELVTFPRSFDAQTPDTLADYFVNDAPIIPSSVLIPKAVFDAVGLFDERFDTFGEDTEMWLRIATAYRFQEVPELLVRKRVHGIQITTNLARHLPVAERLTHLATERSPELRPLIRKRLGRICATAGHSSIKNGERMRGLGLLLRSLLLRPDHAKTWAYLVHALLPTGLGGWVRGLRRALRDRKK
ncbi:MAG: glycosyltransferase family 2 protein [Gammaproteobacteria bacterium]